MGHSSDKGTTVGWASNLQDVECPQSLKNFSWWIYIDDRQQWRTVGYAFAIRCLPDTDIKDQERKPYGLKLDAIAPSSHVQSHDETEILKTTTLFISKP